jgi:2-keto-4-pentenoate hydratase/2-oxohepta-3-ene-1,7-dioic acid hydratase in catechol pathway
VNTINIGDSQIAPSKIVCVGRNYLAHIQELNNEVPENMVLFIKPNSSISEQLSSQQVGNSDNEALHYETEICFLYDNNQLCGVGIGLDLTKRNLQASLKSKGLPWERAKCFDGAALFSDFIKIDHISEQLNLTLHINGVATQHAHTSHMIYCVPSILSQIQSFMSLVDGDIIMTGTPAGVGVIEQGALFECRLYDGQQLLIEKSWHAN